MLNNTDDTELIEICRKRCIEKQFVKHIIEVTKATEVIEDYSLVVDNICEVFSSKLFEDYDNIASINPKLYKKQCAISLEEVFKQILEQTKKSHDSNNIEVKALYFFVLTCKLISCSEFDSYKPIRHHIEEYLSNKSPNACISASILEALAISELENLENNEEHIKEFILKEFFCASSIVNLDDAKLQTYRINIIKCFSNAFIDSDLAIIKKNSLIKHPKSVDYSITMYAFFSGQYILLDFLVRSGFPIDYDIEVTDILDKRKSMNFRDYILGLKLQNPYFIDTQSYIKSLTSSNKIIYINLSTNIVINYLIYYPGNYITTPLVPYNNNASLEDRLEFFINIKGNDNKKLQLSLIVHKMLISSPGSIGESDVIIEYIFNKYPAETLQIFDTEKFKDIYKFRIYHLLSIIKNPILLQHILDNILFINNENQEYKKAFYKKLYSNAIINGNDSISKYIKEKMNFKVEISKADYDDVVKKSCEEYLNAMNSSDIEQVGYKPKFSDFAHIDNPFIRKKIYESICGISVIDSTKYKTTQDISYVFLGGFLLTSFIFLCANCPNKMYHILRVKENIFSKHKVFSNIFCPVFIVSLSKWCQATRNNRIAHNIKTYRSEIEESVKKDFCIT